MKLLMMLALTLTLCGCKVKRISADNPDIANLCGDERIHDCLIYAIAHATNQADVLPVFAAKMNDVTIDWLATTHTPAQLEQLIESKSNGRALHHYTDEQLATAMKLCTANSHYPKTKDWKW